MAKAVLVVDDDRLIRQLFTDVFIECGWRADAVPNAEEALEAMAQLRYDALLIDKNMPGMSGVDLVQKIRREDERVVCAIITGYPSAESAMRALQLGIDAYIEKPAPDPLWVVDKVEALVRKREQRAALLQVSRGREPDRRGATAVRALVASPSAVDAGAVESWLREAGLVVETVITPSDAVIERALNDEPDLFVVDNALAKPNVPTYLSSLPDSTVCVVMSEKAPALRAVVEFIDVEIAAVLEKPVDAGDLDERLAPVVRRLFAAAAKPTGAG